MKIPSCDIFEIASANKLFNRGDNSMQSYNAIYLKTVFKIETPKRQNFNVDQVGKILNRISCLESIVLPIVVTYCPFIY